MSVIFNLIYRDCKKYNPIYNILSEYHYKTLKLLSEYIDDEPREKDVASFIVYMHFCHFVEYYYRCKYNVNKSEKILKYFLNSLCDEIDPSISTNSMIEYARNLITELSAWQRMVERKDEYFFANNIYEAISEHLIKEVCFPDTYFYKIDENIETEITALLINFDMTVKSLNI